MNEIMRESTLRALTVQRNVFLSLAFCLVFLTVLLSLLLFRKTERVIVVPATIEKEFWVEGANVSPSYLEQMGCFVGDLLLTRSPSSADMQLTILMRQVDPHFAPHLREKLSKELAKLRKDKASYVFFKINVVVNPDNLSVTLEGDRTLFLGDKVLSNVRESYRLGFANNGGRLQLASLERVEEN